MRILILGGTGFIGSEIVGTLLTAGHQVSTLNRGLTRDELPNQVERLRGDRDQAIAGLHALRCGSWDVCVDVSGYTARHVRSSAEMLQTVVNRYVFVSAVSVYGDPERRPVSEDQRRILPGGEEVTEVNAETYGRLKVTCETIVQQVFAERCTLLRPQIVVGPHDPRGRYAYWVQRANRGGEMLAPGDGSDHLQVIDVRDVAQFARIVIEKDVRGAFNLAGPRLAWSEFINLLGARNAVWVPAEIIKSAGVTESELPLYRPERGPRSSLMDVSSQRALNAGLVLTEPRATMRFMQAGIRPGNQPSWLSPEREAELIRISHRSIVSPRN
jgi:2'-hydroxyisoflavone reductase